MDGLLTPVSTVRTKSKHDDGQNLFSQVTNQDPRPNDISSPQNALEILKHEPSFDSLVSALRFLSRHQSDGDDVTSIRLPSPLSAQLVQVLVSEIVPNYWSLLKEDIQESKNSGMKLLLYCLSSITGINGILIEIRSLINRLKSESSNQLKTPDITINLGVFLDLLSSLLKGDDWILDAWRIATTGQDGTMRNRAKLQNILATFGSGRVISLAAEAEDVVRTNKTNRIISEVWPADAVKYTLWLGRNIIKWQLSDKAPDDPKFGSDLFSKALKLGHTNSLTRLLTSELVLKKGADGSKFGDLLDNLPPSEQRQVVSLMLKQFSADHLDRLGRCETEDSRLMIAAVAGALKSIIGEKESLRNHLVDWLTSSSGAGLGESVGIRRSVLAVISQYKDDLVKILEKSLSQFGDQLYIKHSPMLQQEAHVQVLLLSAGYVYKKSPIKLTLIMRTGVWMTAISNRLSAPHQQARFLGMVVGEGLSGLVDKGDKRLDFHMEETTKEEGKWYKDLATVSDNIGTLDPLFKTQAIPAKNNPTPQPAVRKQPAQPAQTGFIIEELIDEEAPEDDDIVPYAKPDSDDEDSDDDPTLIRRDKPKAPVYIRDLIKYLRDSDSYDHQELALTTAPTLIRRKADYGTEVSEHAEEIGSLLVGLSDRYEVEDFDELKVQGMIALIVSQPKTMGQWFAKTFFDGDYSISQRASILIVLGLSARELAGFDTSSYAAASFPSKTLPERVEKLYIDQGSTSTYQKPSSTLKPLPFNALDGIASSLTSKFLAPIAEKAADAATGATTAKLLTLDSERSKRHVRSVKPRVRSIPNTTATLISSSFFSPLIARFQGALHSSASNRVRGIMFQPYLLSLYLKTLAILIHSSGPSTLSLPQMTAELWRLLLHTSIRAQAVGDISVTRAILFGFVSLLDVNEDRMRDVCRELGREVAEAQEWTAGIFSHLRGGDEGGEEEQVKMLAAGVLVRLGEGIEKHREVTMAELLSFDGR
ncbi:telomere length regulation protein-domain-containing protein [Podospora fimiseda]|uniref:Telomere length regulation protein-domain-containing protein n=1 Tax=Podospora fimiseda TaxID=252190 RepID=A0AAN6YPW1_9PEZI|nr:telomere length regulation protein-domain-containing protein [Podospora fimiseda]